MSSKPIYYSQYDPKWKNIRYSSIGDEKQTIGSSGCGITCMAMVLTQFGIPMTPTTCARLALDMGDRTANDGTEWEYFAHMAKRYSLSLEQTSSTSEAIVALNSGALVICSMSKGYFTNGGHFILAWGATINENILVNDPANLAKDKASKDIFIAECRQYFIFRKVANKTMDKPIEVKPEVPQWKVDAVKKAKDLGFIKELHDPLEKVDFGTLCQILINMEV